MADTASKAIAAEQGPHSDFWSLALAAGANAAFEDALPSWAWILVAVGLGLVCAVLGFQCANRSFVGRMNPELAWRENQYKGRGVDVEMSNTRGRSATDRLYSIDHGAMGPVVRGMQGAVRQSMPSVQRKSSRTSTARPRLVTADETSSNKESFSAEEVVGREAALQAEEEEFAKIMAKKRPSAMSVRSTGPTDTGLGAGFEDQNEQVQPPSSFTREPRTSQRRSTAAHATDVPPLPAPHDAPVPDITEKVEATAFSALAAQLDGVESFESVASKLFEEHDTDKSGELEESELNPLLAKLAEEIFQMWKAKCPELSEGYKGQLMTEMRWSLDSDFSGTVSKDEFVTNIRKLIQDNDLRGGE